MITARDIAKMIDHSLLRPELTKEQVTEGCRIAAEYGTATVCVKPCDVAIAKEELGYTNVLTTTVIGFPHGSNVTEVKVFEAERAIKDGALAVRSTGTVKFGATATKDIMEEALKGSRMASLKKYSSRMAHH